MLFLEELEVEKCHALKHLITDKGDGHDHMNKSSIFPKLEKVSIKNCRLLESLFPASHCTTFDHVQSVKISRAHKLRYVFGKCYCENTLAHRNQNVEIRLPTLEQLLIHDIPNMVNICSQNSYITTLSLKEFSLIECPQLPIRPLLDFKVGHETQEDLASTKVLEIQLENLTDLHLNNVNIERIYDLERPQIKELIISMLERTWLKNLPELRKCKSLKCLFSISTCGVLPNLGYKQGETKEMIMKDVFPKLETLKLVSLPSLDCVCQGIDFQTVPERFVHDCPNISLTSTVTISDDDVDDKDEYSSEEESLEDQDDEFKATSDEVPFQSQKEATKAIVDEDLEIQEENNNTPNLIESNKEAVNEVSKQVPTSDVPAMLASSSNSIPQQKPSLIQERKEPSVPEGPKLQKATIADEIMDSEEIISKVSPRPLFIPLQNESPQSKKEAKKEFIDEDLEIQEQNSNNSNLIESNKVAPNEAIEQVPSSDIPTMAASPSNSDMSMERGELSVQEGLKSHKETRANEIMDSEGLSKASPATFLIFSQNESPQNTEESTGEGPSSEKYNKPSSSTTKELNETVRGVEKSLDNTQDVEEPTNECSSEEKSNITALAIPPTLEEMKDSISSIPSSKKPQAGVSQSNQADISGNSEFPQDKIIVNQSVTDNPKQFEEDDLIRLFRIMEKSADMKVHKPFVSKNFAIEDDNNKVAKALSDMEISLKMGLQEIASSEENIIRLQDALSFLSSHYFEDGDPSHGLKPTIESLHQEIPSILSSFKQVSARLSTIDTFTELEEKEKNDNEVAKAFADLEASLKMDLNKIVSSEEDNLRLQNALKFLSSQCSEEDGAPSPGLSATIDSLPPPRRKEKHMINEELPQRKLAANTLNSDIDKTEKSMAELKEKILRLQAELNNKEKEFKECEIKLSCMS
ncbi:putative disease resistance protein [Senna tora]|uniref:Putative disease resistance protein n=1 Tax=Senna tora TaxID=362788 RepID=A0A834XDI2_9FABA|nr:putative disease resistance protein [Senna tora]